MVSLVDDLYSVYLDMWLFVSDSDIPVCIPFTPCYLTWLCLPSDIPFCPWFWPLPFLTTLLRLLINILVSSSPMWSCSVKERFTYQHGGNWNWLLGEHHQWLAEAEKCLAHLSMTSRPDSVNPTFTNVSLAQPDKFDLKTSNCNGFLLQCSLYFTSCTGLSEV